jgi:hypothetical protein
MRFLAPSAHQAGRIYQRRFPHPLRSTFAVSSTLAVSSPPDPARLFHRAALLGFHGPSPQNPDHREVRSSFTTLPCCLCPIRRSRYRSLGSHRQSLAQSSHSWARGLTRSGLLAAHRPEGPCAPRLLLRADSRVCVGPSKTGVYPAPTCRAGASEPGEAAFCFVPNQSSERLPGRVTS